MANGRPVSVTDLMKEPMVLREKGSGTRATVERFLKEKINVDLASFNIVAELGSSEAIKEAVLEELGISVLSTRAVRRELKMGLLRELAVEDWQIERPLYLIYRRNANFMRHHQVFLEFIRNYNQEEPSASSR
jgi:DNA-binding transcriptional LysR family regulator